MFSNILEIPIKSAAVYPDRVSHKVPTENGFITKTYRDLLNSISALTAGLAHFGVSPKDHIGFFMNNRFEWITTDFSLIALGAVSVPRGSDTPPTEVKFIFQHSDARFMVLETLDQLDELCGVFEEKDWEPCQKIFIAEEGDVSAIPETLKNKVHFYRKILEIGKSEFDRNPKLLSELSAKIKGDDLLTIVYTSGTTGNPKGVMLTHTNFIQNVNANTPRLQIDPDRPETSVVMLPSWHVYERAFEYCAASAGLTIVYSSAKQFAADLASEKPEILITVPRIWESIHQKMITTISQLPAAKRSILYFFINLNKNYLASTQYMAGSYISLKNRGLLRRCTASLCHALRRAFLTPGHLAAVKLFKPFREKVGGRLRVAVSGAGSLPRYLDELFNSLGITIINAYGMTECAPGILSRTFENNTIGTTGVPFDNTEVEIRLEDGSAAGVGEKGIVFARGPQMMLGYYKNPEATAKVLSTDGWLNTGDLAVKAENGETIIIGRIKDTIVLMGGENVEPEVIEEKMKESVYIDHAVVLGQDRKQLSAIVAVNEDALMQLAEELKLNPGDVHLAGKNSIANEDILKTLMKEVNGLISREHGFKPFEAISKILAVPNDFTVGKELTQTLKIKRKMIEERFQKGILQL
jgi:long-chain acyl-CoA synthetase